MPDERRKSFEVKWRIENLKSWFHSRDDCLYSPQFLVETFANTRWKLRLSRKLHLAEKYISLALERDVEDDHSEAIVLNYEVSFLKCDESALKSKSCTSKFAPETISKELNVKEIEIFNEKKEDYLPQGVLTVCCKLWRAWSTSKGERYCSIRTVIGKKCVTLDGTIEDFSELSCGREVTANLASPYSDISFISFYVREDTYSCHMRFESKKFESKELNFNSFKLFFLDAGGQRTEITEGCNVEKFGHHFHKFQSSYSQNYFLNRITNNIMTLQLEVTYYPSIKSESIEYDDSNFKKVSAEPADLENVKSANCKKSHFQPLDSLNLLEHGEIQFDIEKNKSTYEDDCFDAPEERNLPSTTLKEDLTSLYNDRLFCDTKLQTETETFPAHRNVLSARSPVFKKMFTTDMKEKAGECINVTDISSDTVRRMLQFLYTDCTGDLEMNSAKDLYIASDKYDIASLKQRCTSFLKKNLCPANVCDVIVLADLHLDKDLLSAAHEFVLTYDQEVFGSDEWRLFMKNFSNLAAEVMYLKCMKK